MEEWIPRKLVTPSEKRKIMFFSRMFNIHPIVSYLLYARGYCTEESIRHFLYPSVNDFSNPFLLKDLEKGVHRILQAIRSNEIIGIFGDYDVDGITSTSMMTKAIHSLGGTAFPLIPLRSEGYGLSKQAVNVLKEKGVTLLLTLDNGSSCFEEIQYANQLGIETIILDHHDILKEYPPAYAFVNPKRKDDTSGLSYLSGAGVTFKCIQSMYELSFLPWHIYLQDYIELATLSTICDMVPLIEENHLLCRLGLNKMNFNPSFPIKTLKQFLSVSPANSNSVSFTIGPLINGFGRYDNPNLLIPFLAFDKWDSWLENKCRFVNSNRKKISHQQTLLAEDMIAYHQLHTYDALHIHGDFHEGILGILASKFSKKYKKPTLISCLNGKGSARSIPNSDFSIIDFLNQFSMYFEKFGGHKQAAGFSIKPHVIGEFHSAICSATIPSAYKSQVIPYDMDLPVGSFPKTLFEEFSMLEPFGIGNPKPTFRCTNTSFHQVECFGKHDIHLKCLIKPYHLYSFFANSEDVSTLTYHEFDILYAPLGSDEFVIESFQTNEKTPFPIVI